MNNKVYIAGKISGLSREKVLKNFYKAHTHLIGLGFTVYNPVQFITDISMDYENIMSICMVYLSEADILYLLPNWRNSEGARREVAYAKEHNIMIIEGS